MKRISHWNRKYIANRIAHKWYQRTHRDVPWLTRTCVEFLDSWLKPTDSGLEFGSGRSTRWFLDRVAKLVSVENNERWHQVVSDDCRSAIEEGRLDLRFLVGRDEYLGLIDEIDDDSLDFCLIDGNFRDECAENVIQKIRPGGIIIIDDINLYIPYVESVSPNSRTREMGVAEGRWSVVASNPRVHRHYITTDGVSDTGILFKI